MATLDRVAVVIAAHATDRLGKIEKCVGSVMAGDWLPAEIVVVVDQNPELFGLLGECLPPEVSVIANEGKGASMARNTGFAVVSSEVVCCIDDDAWADPSWLGLLAGVFNDPTVTAAGGRILPDFESESGYHLPPELYWVVGATYRGHGEDAGPISRPIGANMAFRREAFLAVGGFPTEFGPTGVVKKSNSNEELALALRLRERFGDQTIKYQPEAVVHHFAPSSRLTWQYFVNRCWVEGRSKAAVRTIATSSSMSHDRGYLLQVLSPAVVTYGIRGLQGSSTDLQHSLRAITAVVVTGCGYLAGRIASLRPTVFDRR